MKDELTSIFNKCYLMYSGPTQMLELLFTAAQHCVY